MDFQKIDTFNSENTEFKIVLQPSNPLFIMKLLYYGCTVREISFYLQDFNICFDRLISSIPNMCKLKEQFNLNNFNKFYKFGFINKDIPFIVSPLGIFINPDFNSLYANEVYSPVLKSLFSLNNRFISLTSEKSFFLESYGNELAPRNITYPIILNSEFYLINVQNIKHKC